MPEDTSIAEKKEEAPLVLTEQVKAVIIRDVLPPGSSEPELIRFLETCRAYGVHPLKKQLYAFRDKKDGKLVVQPTIDGFFSMAESTGDYAGTGDTKFEYNDKNQLVRATATVYRYGRDGQRYSVSASALYNEFTQQTTPWLRMPEVMTEKVALSRCLRRAFPSALGGLYTREEYQPENEPVVQPPLVVDAHVTHVATEPLGRQLEEAAEARVPAKPPEVHERPNDIDTQNSGNPLTDHAAPPPPPKPAAKKAPPKW